MVSSIRTIAGEIVKTAGVGRASVGGKGVKRQSKIGLTVDGTWRA
jgi:hypothetical protein